MKGGLALSIIIDDVSFSYGRSRPKAVLHASVKIPPGITGIIGLNGSGKTTLMRLIAGSLRPDAGKIIGVPSGHLDMGILPQKVSPPRGFTCGDYIIYSAWLRGYKMGESECQKSLEKVSLGDKYNIKCRSLSGGEQHRLAFAAAASPSPKILILDEPTTGLDIKQRALMISSIKRRSQSDFTIISSHIAADLLETCNFIIYMNSGTPLPLMSVEEARSLSLLKLSEKEE